MPSHCPLVCYINSNTDPFILAKRWEYHLSLHFHYLKFHLQFHLRFNFNAKWSQWTATGQISSHQKSQRLLKLLCRPWSLQPSIIEVRGSWSITKTVLTLKFDSPFWASYDSASWLVKRQLGASYDPTRSQLNASYESVMKHNLWSCVQWAGQHLSHLFWQLNFSANFRMFWPTTNRTLEI